MCVMIVQEPNVELSKELLKQCFDNNSHGCGYTFAKDGAIYYNKTLDFEEFYESYSKDREANQDLYFLVHFRLATHGEVNLDNAHPFVVNDKMIMMHNGTINNCTPAKGDVRSDSKVFAEDIIANLPDGWEDNRACMELVEKYIGASKVLTLTNDGNITIFNEHLGNEYLGCWFSNYSYYKDTRSIVKARPTHGVFEKPRKVLEMDDYRSRWGSYGSLDKGKIVKDLRSAFFTPSGELVNYLGSKRYKLECGAYGFLYWIEVTIRDVEVYNGATIPADATFADVKDFFDFRKERAPHLKCNLLYDNQHALVENKYSCSFCNNNFGIKSINFILFGDHVEALCNSCKTDLMKDSAGMPDLKLITNVKNPEAYYNKHILGGELIGATT